MQRSEASETQTYYSQDGRRPLAFRIDRVMTYVACCEPKSPRDNCCQNIKEYSVLVLDDDIFFSSHKIKDLYSR